MKHLLFLLSLTTIACHESSNTCADVQYYNPATGKKSQYTLKVDVENGKLTKLYFPNGGWLDDDHFTPPEIVNNYATFTNDKGYEYEIWLVDESNCNW